PTAPMPYPVGGIPSGDRGGSAQTCRKDMAEEEGFLAPLRYGIFRRIWAASILSNLGQLVQGVGAAWAMTELTHRADMVAAVQSVLMAPILLFGIAAGAFADMFDRRKVCLWALGFVLVNALSLALLSLAGLITPTLILVLCFSVGSGMALFGPA